MEIVYANEALRPDSRPTVFLAGPTPRAPEGPGLSFLVSIFRRALRGILPSGRTARLAGTRPWRAEAISELAAQGFTGRVLVPEDRDGVMKHSYMDQVEWEWQGLHLADAVLFWVPRQLRRLPGFTTNVEFGFWAAKEPTKVVFGAPSGAPKNRYLRHLAGKVGIASFSTLSDTVAATLALLATKAKTAQVALAPPTKSVIYVDVDDTLMRSYGSKRIPMPEMVRLVRKLKDEGAVSLILWSSGGAAYARRTASELGILDCFEAFLPKPALIIDDVKISGWKLRELHPNEALSLSPADLATGEGPATATPRTAEEHRGGQE